MKGGCGWKKKRKKRDTSEFLLRCRALYTHGGALGFVPPGARAYRPSPNVYRPVRDLSGGEKKVVWCAHDDDDKCRPSHHGASIP